MSEFLYENICQRIGMYVVISDEGMKQEESSCNSTRVKLNSIYW